jgi:alpha-1,2-mannosyltransferase
MERQVSFRGVGTILTGLKIFTVQTRPLLRAVAVVGLLATVVVAFQQQRRVERKLADPAGGHISDFDRWMLMTPAFLHDRVDYVDDQLPTPPLSLIVFAPFAAMTRPHAHFAWVLVKYPLAVLVFMLAAAMVARAGVRLTTEAVALMMAGWWLAVIVDMQEGQTNFLALAPLAAGLYVAQRGTRATDVAAGTLIGLGAAMKVTPVIFIAYFLWKRRWTIVLSAAAAIAIWSLVVPALAFGWTQNIRWFEQWARIMIVPYVAQGKVVYATSQSIGSFVLRFLTDTPAFGSRFDHADHYMNIASLSNDAARWIVRGTMIAIGVAGLALTWPPLRSLASRRYIVEVGAVAAFMLWFSERSWVHHYVSFILTLAAAGMILSEPSRTEAARRSVRASLIAFAVITVFASEAGYLFGRNGVDWAKALGVYLWPSVLVTAAVVRTEFEFPPGWRAAAARRSSGATSAPSGHPLPPAARG